MDRLRSVTYCGLYCKLCAARSRIPRQANELRASMTKEGWDVWGKDIPGFNEFWSFFTGLCDKACPGCRQGGGPPLCAIRKCARRRNVDVCVFCDAYPCEHIRAIAKGYPTLIADGQRLKEVGLDQWLAEQEKRAETGFAYVDVRYHPYTVPQE